MSRPYPHEREHYRVVYPTAARPWFLVAGVAREVVDLCEMGLRYRAMPDDQPEMGDEIHGLLRVRRGETAELAGVVVRLVEHQVALRLSRGIPLRIVLDEQRYLREHHRGSAW
jgi:hypothetical protein